MYIKSSLSYSSSTPLFLSAYLFIFFLLFTRFSIAFPILSEFLNFVFLLTNSPINYFGVWQNNFLKVSLGQFSAFLRTSFKFSSLSQFVLRYTLMCSIGHSDWPSVCACPVVASFLVVPRDLGVLCQVWEVNCGPLSLTIESGTFIF
jgi:hypothetical protein